MKKTPTADRRAAKHADIFRNFDNLPDAAYVRQPVVEMLTGSSSSSVWRAVKAGKLPAPQHIGLGISGWNVGTLRRALKPSA